MLMTATADCITATETQGQTLLAGWLKAADLSADCWPLDRATAAALLVAGGYAVTEAELNRLGALGQLPDLGSWDARDVLAAAANLEGRRQWMLAPSPHDLKKTSYQIVLESHFVAGPEGVLAFRKLFGQFDVRLALILMVEADSREIRERLLATVTGLLAADVLEKVAL